MKKRICRFLALSCLVCLSIPLEYSLAGGGSTNQAGPLSPRAEFLETNAIGVFGTPTFIKSYKNFETAVGSEFEYHDLSDILTTDDGGIIVAVRDVVDFPSYDANYVVIMKLTRLGELEWQVVQAGCWGDGPIALVPSREGGYFVAFSIAFQYVGPYAPCVMRIGPTGVVQWIKSYSWRLEDVLSSATATRDGGIVLAGTQGDEPNTIPWLLKLDDAGRIVWQTRMEARASILGVKETPDGGLIAVGSRLGPEGVGHHALVIRMDGKAEVEWVEILPDAHGWDILASSVEPTIDGGYSVAGADE